MTAMRRPRRYRQDPEALASMAWHHPWTPTEAEMTELFLEIAEHTGWEVRVHVHDSRQMDLRSTPGMADWFMANPSQKRTAWFELKGFAGVASVEQREFLRAVNDAGGEGYLVGTSGDRALDQIRIAELLQARPRRAA